MSIVVAPDEGQPFAWWRSRPDVLAGLLNAPEAGLAFGDRRSRTIITAPPGISKTMFFGMVIAELLERQREGDQLFIIDVGAELSGLRSIAARTLAREAADELVLPNSTFQIGERSYPSLVRSDGTIYCEKPHQLLLRPTGRMPSPLRPPSNAEIEARKFRGPISAASTEADAVDALLPQLMGRVNRHRPQDLAALVRARARGLEALMRFVFNRLIVLFKRLLGIKRQRIELQPSALTHQHSVDQYRIRGPNFSRKTSFSIFFREPVAA